MIKDLQYVKHICEGVSKIPITLEFSGRKFILKE